MNLNKNLFQKTILIIALLEALSFFGYFFSAANKVVFVALLVITLLASLKNLEYGLWLLLAELVIGSKGYLFSFDRLSIRIGMWLVVMAVWFGKIVIKVIKNKGIKNLLNELAVTSKSGPWSITALLFAFVGWGIINGLIHNDLTNVFFDANGWIYFLLIFPLWTTISSRETLDKLMSVLAGALVWLGLKTLILLYLFSHAQSQVLFPLYRWVRVTGVGEITLLGEGFYRIFMQSHIYGLLAFIVLAVGLAKKIAEQKISQYVKEKRNRIILAALSFTLAIVLISFSRSFWVGLAAGLVLVYACLFYCMPRVEPNTIKLKSCLGKFFSLSTLLLSTLIAALFLIVVIVKFPYPNPLGGNIIDTFSERATETNEAAIGSRWALLQPLWQSVKSAPLLGQGFGATVTYYSQDPRVLERNPKGEYTTYAFEWGWLDIWLKLGLGGLACYLVLIGFLALLGFKQASEADNNYWGGIALTAGLTVLAIVNFFTPYLNHPLGIGYILLSLVILSNNS